MFASNFFVFKDTAIWLKQQLLFYYYSTEIYLCILFCLE